jgi:hypothetical protein
MVRDDFARLLWVYGLMNTFIDLSAASKAPGLMWDRQWRKKVIVSLFNRWSVRSK